MPVRSSLVATPFCPFFFCLKGEAAYHHPYAYAYAHAHAQSRALWVGGLSLLPFFFCWKRGAGLPVPMRSKLGWWPPAPVYF